MSRCPPTVYSENWRHSKACVLVKSILLLPLRRAACVGCFCFLSFACSEFCDELIKLDSGINTASRHATRCSNLLNFSSRPTYQITKSPIGYPDVAREYISALHPPQLSTFLFRYSYSKPQDMKHNIIKYTPS